MHTLFYIYNEAGCAGRQKPESNEITQVTVITMIKIKLYARSTCATVYNNYYYV